jgi:hypothetical protein
MFDIDVQHSQIAGGRQAVTSDTEHCIAHKRNR